MAGKKIFRAIGYVSPSARDGEITKSEYKMMEDKIRDGMLDALERINGTMPMLKSRVMAGMKEWESRVIERVHRRQKKDLSVWKIRPRRSWRRSKTTSRIRKPKMTR